MESLLRQNRKYKAFLLAFLTASIMLAFDKLTGTEWVTFCGAVYATYAVANVRTAANAIRGRDNAGGDS